MSEGSLWPHKRLWDWGRPDIVFSSTGRVERRSQALPGNAAIDFSSTGRVESKSGGFLKPPGSFPGPRSKTGKQREIYSFDLVPNTITLVVQLLTIIACFGFGSSPGTSGGVPGLLGKPPASAHQVHEMAFSLTGRGEVHREHSRRVHEKAISWTGSGESASQAHTKSMKRLLPRRTGGKAHCKRTPSP